MLVVCDLLVPDQLARLGVQRNQMGIASSDDQLVIVDRLGALAAGVHVIGELVFILPDQITRGPVEGLDEVA